MSHACRLTTRSTASGGVEARDVAALEAEAGRARALRQCCARRDHVLLQVEPDDLDLAPAQHGEQVMDREGQVRLAAAEVDDAQRAVGPQRGNDVVDELEEAVDLAELVVAALAHAAVRRHDAELDEERNRRSLLEQIALAPVVLARSDRARRRPSQHRLAEDLPIGVGRLEQPLAVVGEQDAEPLAGRSGREVLVRRAVAEVGREAKRRLAAQFDRIDRDLCGQVAGARLRDDGAREGQSLEQVREERVCLGHARHDG